MFRLTRSYWTDIHPLIYRNPFFSSGTDSENKVVYSDSTESFGIRPKQPDITYLNNKIVKTNGHVTNGHSKGHKESLPFNVYFKKIGRRIFFSLITIEILQDASLTNCSQIQLIFNKGKFPYHQHFTMNCTRANS